MEYANFTQAFLGGDKKAEAIALAMDTAMASLVKQGLVENSTGMWKGLCSQAWASHVEAQQR
jgi:hypothetical protein